MSGWKLKAKMRNVYVKEDESVKEKFIHANVCNRNVKLPQNDKEVIR